MDNEKKSLIPENEDNDFLTDAAKSQDSEQEDGEIGFESTIFTSSTPDNQAEKKSLGKKRGIITIISMLLVVAVICVSVYCVNKYDGKDETSSQSSFSIKINATDYKTVQKINIVNSYGKYTLLPEVKANDDGSDTVEWSIENIDNPLISAASIGTVADSCLTVYATREMQDKTLDYGFESPTASVEIITKEGKGDCTLIFGDNTPDKTGYYVKLNGDDKIYVAAAGTFNDVNFSLEKLSDLVLLEVPELSDTTLKEDKKYYGTEGTISSFDFIELSGAAYDNKKIVITPIENNEMVKYSVKTTDGERYAETETCEEVFSVLTNGLVAVKAYKLSPTNGDLKSYKLDRPDYTFYAKYGSKSIKISASYYDEKNNYFAAKIEGRDAIYAMSADALSMFGKEKEEFYNELVFLEYYNAFSKVTINTVNGEYVFDTEYRENAEKDKFIVYANNKKVDEELYTSYYEHIVDIAPKAQESYIDGAPSYSAVFTFADSSKGEKTLTLTKQSDRRYLVTVDGKKMGIVNSSVYDNLVDYVDYIISGKEIPLP